MEATTETSIAIETNISAPQNKNLYQCNSSVYPCNTASVITYQAIGNVCNVVNSNKEEDRDCDPRIPIDRCVSSQTMAFVNGNYEKDYSAEKNRKTSIVDVNFHSILDNYSKLCFLKYLDERDLLSLRLVSRATNVIANAVLRSSRNSLVINCLWSTEKIITLLNLFGNIREIELKFAFYPDDMKIVTSLEKAQFWKNCANVKSFVARCTVSPRAVYALLSRSFHEVKSKREKQTKQLFQLDKITLEGSYSNEELSDILDTYSDSLHEFTFTLCEYFESNSLSLQLRCLFNISTKPLAISLIGNASFLEHFGSNVQRIRLQNLCPECCIRKMSTSRNCKLQFLALVCETVDSADGPLSAKLQCAPLDVRLLSEKFPYLRSLELGATCFLNFASLSTLSDTLETLHIVCCYETFSENNVVGDDESIFFDREATRIDENQNRQVPNDNKRKIQRYLKNLRQLSFTAKNGHSTRLQRILTQCVKHAISLIALPTTVHRYEGLYSSLHNSSNIGSVRHTKPLSRDNANSRKPTFFFGTSCEEQTVDSVKQRSVRYICSQNIREQINFHTDYSDSEYVGSKMQEGKQFSEPFHCCDGCQCRKSTKKETYNDCDDEQYFAEDANTRLTITFNYTLYSESIVTSQILSYIRKKLTSNAQLVYDTRTKSAIKGCVGYNIFKQVCCSYSGLCCRHSKDASNVDKATLKLTITDNARTASFVKKNRLRLPVKIMINAYIDDELIGNMFRWHYKLAKTIKNSSRNFQTTTVNLFIPEASLASLWVESDEVRYVEDKVRRLKRSKSIQMKVNTY